MRRHLGRLLTIAASFGSRTRPWGVALSAVALASTAGMTTALGAGPGVCAGVADCRVVAWADVNGDGSSDAIGMVRHGEDGDPEGSVVVRVETAPGVIASIFTRTEYWYSSPWQGVAALDGRKGKEILVGRTMGAHSQFYRALTWRDGDLTTLNAPGSGTDWYIDSAVWVSAGWQQEPSDPPGVMRKRYAERTGDAVHSRFKGTVTTYRWTSAGWSRTRSRTIYPLRDATAYSWGGFRVPGLNRW